MTGETGREVVEVPLREVGPLLREAFPPSLRWSLRLACALLPGVLCCAVRDGGRVVAALVGRRSGGWWEVVSVAVAPDRRKEGLGRRLVEGFAAEAEAAGRPIVAWVRRSNAASRALFESLGFRRARVLSFPYALEEILPWGDHYVRQPGEARP